MTRRDLYRRALGGPSPFQLPPMKLTRRLRLEFWWNDLRFNLGYRIGGFRSASREPR